MVEQTVSSLRYSDLDAVRNYLGKLFAGQVWSVTWRRGQAVIETPRTLSEKELSQVKHYGGGEDE